MKQSSYNVWENTENAKKTQECTILGSSQRWLKSCINNFKIYDHQYHSSDN